MKCPFCGEEMEKGRITSPKGIGIPWYPDGVPYFAFCTMDWRVEQRGGVMLRSSWPPVAITHRMQELPTYLCRKCKKGVFSYSDG